MSEEMFKNSKDGICDWCVDKLYKLWIENCRPEGEGGPTTGMYMPPETLANDLGDNSTENDVSAYNSIIEKLYALVDCRHIGSGIWYTDYYTSAEYIAFCEAGREIVTDYIRDNLWEDFCNNHVWETE